MEFNIKHLKLISNALSLEIERLNNILDFIGYDHESDDSLAERQACISASISGYQEVYEAIQQEIERQERIIVNLQEEN